MFITGLCVSSLFIAFGAIVHTKNGFEAHYRAAFDSRQQEVWKSFASDIYTEKECRYRLTGENLYSERFENCRQRYGNAIVILGGSHGMDFSIHSWLIVQLLSLLVLLRAVVDHINR